jgi:hypothetical protein
VGHPTGLSGRHRRQRFFPEMRLPSRDRQGKLRRMKTRAISLCAGLLLLLWFVPAAAEQPGDLYAAEVAVADEGSEARNAALSQRQRRGGRYARRA